MSRERFLELDNATVIKDETRLLDGLSLSIHVGEHTAILGPNGSGKSTFIKLLTHEYYPVAADNGAAPVRVFGSIRWNVWELRSRLGIVSASLHEGFVRGNSAGGIKGLDAVISGFFSTQGLFAHHKVTAAMRRRAAGALDLMDAGHLAPKRLDEMSTGEARRVLIARALVTAPEALVLDEPTRGLDLVAQHRFMERVRRVARQGTTLVLVTHHVEEIIPEIERVILLRRGRVAHDGPKHAILTSDRLSEAYEAPVGLRQSDGYYRVELENAHEQVG